MLKLHFAIPRLQTVQKKIHGWNQLQTGHILIVWFINKITFWSPCSSRFHHHSNLGGGSLWEEEVTLYDYMMQTYAQHWYVWRTFWDEWRHTNLTCLSTVIFNSVMSHICKEWGFPSPIILLTPHHPIHTLPTILLTLPSPPPDLIHPSLVSLLFF